MLELCFLDGSKALDHYFRDNKARENKKLHGMPPKKIVGPFLKSGTKKYILPSTVNGNTKWIQHLQRTFVHSIRQVAQQTPATNTGL